jgi:hypothetical protein
MPQWLASGRFLPSRVRGPSERRTHGELVARRRRLSETRILHALNCRRRPVHKRGSSHRIDSLLRAGRAR